MPVASEFTLFSGGAQGAEAEFGKQAERFGVQEVNYSFEGHKIERARGLRMLTQEELMRKDVSLTYVSKLLDRNFSNGPLIRMVLQMCPLVAAVGIENPERGKHQRFIEPCVAGRMPMQHLVLK